MAGDTGTDGASGGLSYEQQLAADRAAFLSGDDGDELEQDSVAEANETEVDDDADLEEDDTDDDTEEADDSDEEEEADDDSDLDEDDEEPGDKKPKDPEVAKRLEQVRRTEQRMREQLAKERQSFEAERDKLIADLKPRLERAEHFESLTADGRAKYNAVAILSELGLTEDDFELVAHDLFAHSKAGAADPKRKDAVLRTKREREQAERLAKLERELSESRKSTEQREQQAQAQREAERYVDGVTKAIPEKFTLAKQYLAKNPERARADIEAVAIRLARETGSLPDAKTVAKEFERERRRILRDHGVDPRTLYKTATAAKPDDKKPAKGKTAPGKKVSTEARITRADEPLSFEEQRKRDREAFVSGQFD